MVNPDIQFEQHIARTMPQAMGLQLHVLPAHQELIAPLPSGYVGPVMAAAEAWLKHHGYRTLGPWMIAWGPNGQPQLRRPVSGALKAINDKAFQTVEVPEQLLIAVPFVGWPILPYNFTLPVNSVGLEIVGSPLLLALTNDPPTTAWIPVIPRGTGSLFGRARGKLGLHPAPPKAGTLIGIQRAWINALFKLGRFSTVMAFVIIGLFSFGMVISMLDYGILGIADVWVGTLAGTYYFVASPLFGWTMIVCAIAFVVNALILMIAINRWNNFWSQRNPPPELLLGSRGEGQIGAWLG